MKILITGGHHNSALVIAESLRSAGYQVVWVGHRHTMVDDPHDSLEYQEVTAKKFPFISIQAGKFHSQAHPVHFLRLPLGLFQAIGIIWHQKPQLVLTFGGYIAVPIAFAARLANIPIILFEQTTAIGRANKLISHFSQKNFLAWNSSLPYFPSSKSEVVGLPLRPQILLPQQKKWFTRSKPIITVTGGKQGSHSINQAFFPLIPKLLPDFNIIHQTGSVVKTGDSVTAAKIHSPFYLQKSHFISEEMLEALKASDLVISRSGAHIVYELMTLHKPAILIPLPFSYLNEQALNANKLVAANQAIVITQEQLTPSSLFSSIKTIATSPPSPQPSIPPQNATKVIGDYIASNYPHAQSH